MGYKLEFVLDSMKFREVVKVILKFKCLFFYIGGGVIYLGGFDEFFEFVRENCILVVLILMGFGVYLLDDLLFLGMFGMYGIYVVNMVVIECDLLFVLGVCFDDCVIGKLEFFFLNLKKVYIDIDFFEFYKNVIVEYLIVGDVKKVLYMLLYMFIYI